MAATLLQMSRQQARISSAKGRCSRAQEFPGWCQSHPNSTYTTISTRLVRLVLASGLILYGLCPTEHSEVLLRYGGMNRTLRVFIFVLLGSSTATPLMSSALASRKDAIPTDISALAEAVAKLQAEVSYLKTREDIREVYLRYMRGFDRNDLDLMRSAFWPDVQINYGAQSNSIDEFVERHLKNHTAQLETWGHLVTNETMDINGDVAHVETYVTAFFVPRNQESFAFRSPIMGGRYIDRVERRHGEWRIAVREFVPHFWTKKDSTVPSPPKSSSDCSKGTWDKRDPSYRRPLTPRANKAIGPLCAE